MFEFFDPKGELTIRVGNLPHWYQPGVTYFVTFRTDDSVPQALLRSWHSRRDVWLRRHGFDPKGDGWKSNLRENAELDDEYHARFTREFMDYLDRGFGACVLRDANLAQIVAHSLRHFDGERYDLGDFVVMPNHVHLLVGLRGLTEIEALCRSWKKFAAGKINRALARDGRFWQEESFDHLVRSVEQFAHFEGYIAQNPSQAGLGPGEYLAYVRGKASAPAQSRCGSVCRDLAR
ncbi:MAG TPA: transposase [Pirellulales bacterium]|jgi:REP element-mobilizing transposase RayT|nr:transposase [Pirellulales bacterium]